MLEKQKAALNLDNTHIRSVIFTLYKGILIHSSFLASLVMRECLSDWLSLSPKVYELLGLLTIKGSTLSKSKQTWSSSNISAFRS